MLQIFNGSKIKSIHFFLERIMLNTLYVAYEIVKLVKHNNYIDYYITIIPCSRVAQWKRAGPITQRSVDRNHALLKLFYILGFNIF